MDGDLLSCGMDGKLLTVEQIIHPWALSNLTSKTLGALFPTVPDHAVRHRHMVLFGMMESGKTSLMNFIAAEARRRYGYDQVNIIATYSIRKAMDLINSKRVQLILVDDAIQEQNSRTSTKNAQDTADFYQIRHTYEALAGDNGGVVITVWATQRFKSLDIVFRQGHLLIFKTSAVDPEDDKLIKNYIGNKAHTELGKITERIFVNEDDEAKSRCVVCIPISGRIQSGIFNYRYVQPFLHFLGSEEVYQPGEDFVFNLGAVLEKYRNIPKWRKAANAYYQATVEHKQLETLAAKEGVVRSVISERLAQMRGELARIAGSDYEKFKVQQLIRRGWSVEHQGGIGQPDIIAKNLDGGRVVVYSCKCLSFRRQVSIRAHELAPEVHEASRLNATLAVSVFNLEDGREYPEILFNPERMPAVVKVDFGG